MQCLVCEEWEEILDACLLLSFCLPPLHLKGLLPEQHTAADCSGRELVGQTASSKKWSSLISGLWQFDGSLITSHERLAWATAWPKAYLACTAEMGSLWGCLPWRQAYGTSAVRPAPGVESHIRAGMLSPSCSFRKFLDVMVPCWAPLRS